MKFNFLNIKQRYNLKDYKFSLVALVTTISIIGIFVVGSAQASVQGKQIAGVVMGTIAMIVVLAFIRREYRSASGGAVFR